MKGPFKGHFDMALINHAEPLDYAICTDPGHGFGCDSPAFRGLVARHHASTHPRERQRLLFADLQRKLSTDAVNARGWSRRRPAPWRARGCKGCG